MGKENENSTNQRPLLYTTKPNHLQPVRSMQKIFIIKQKSSKQYQVDVDQENKDKSEEIGIRVEGKRGSAAKKSVIFDDEPEIEKKVEKEIEGKKIFTQMSNVEKINYILNRPHYIPNIECAVQTKREVHVGYIISFEKKILKIKSSTKLNFVTIALADIETIRMKGLG